MLISLRHLRLTDKIKPARISWQDMQKIESQDNEYDRMLNKGREYFIIDRLNEIVEEASNFRSIREDYNTTPVLAAIARALRKACEYSNEQDRLE